MDAPRAFEVKSSMLIISPPSSPRPSITGCNIGINIDPSNRAYFNIQFLEDYKSWENIIPSTIEEKKKRFLGQGNHASVYKSIFPLNKYLPLSSFSYQKSAENSFEDVSDIAVKVYHKEEADTLHSSLRELYFQTECYDTLPLNVLKPFGVLVTFKKLFHLITRIKIPQIDTDIIPLREIRYSQVALLVELGPKGSLVTLPNRLLTSDFISKIGYQLGIILDVLKRHRLVHSDIKPQNLFPVYNTNKIGQETLYLKLGDFSSTFKIFSTKDTDIEVEGQGTQSFIAPDVLFSATPSNEAIIGGDTYAAGVTLWMLLTKHIPFEGILSSVHRLIAIKKGFFECGQNHWNYSLSDCSVLVLPSKEILSQEKSQFFISTIKALLHKDVKNRPSLSSCFPC